jgi:hypothetical protein
MKFWSFLCSFLNILPQCGRFYGTLVCFVVIGNIFPVLVLYPKNNQATLAGFDLATLNASALKH